MAEKIGKVFKKKEAEVYYGKVHQSASITAANLKKLLKKTEKHILIRHNNGQVEVLDNERNPLYPKDLKVSNDEVFNVYSVEAVEELLSKSNVADLAVEQRQSVTTITNGESLLEMGKPCPPYCPW